MPSKAGAPTREAVAAACHQKRQGYRTADANACYRSVISCMHGSRGTGRSQLATKPALRLQARVKAISEVVEQLVRGVRGGLDVNVDAIKREAATKYSLARAPKLVEIISAVPDDFRDTLLPRCPHAQTCTSNLAAELLLRAEQADTATWSGLDVILRLGLQNFQAFRNLQAEGQASAHGERHRGGGGHVEAAPLPAHRHHRRCVRVLPRRPRLRLRILHSVVHRQGITAQWWYCDEVTSPVSSFEPGGALLLNVQLKTVCRL